MNFGVAKAIENLNPRIYSDPVPRLSSEPAIDLNNPGVLLKLYTDIVPISVGNIKKLEQKVQKDPDVISDVINAEGHEQTGRGVTLENSFLHPRPVKTEVIELFKNKNKKRKIEVQDDEEKKVKNRLKHKFQLV